MEEKKTFEESLAQLEEIATKLESGNLGLEEAIKEFEKGIKLSKEYYRRVFYEEIFYLFYSYNLRI